MKTVLDLSLKDFPPTSSETGRFFVLTLIFFGQNFRFFFWTKRFLMLKLVYSSETVLPLFAFVTLSRVLFFHHLYTMGDGQKI
jgi:hypothetical protein